MILPTDRHYSMVWATSTLISSVSKLKERYKVDVELSKPKVAFRETIRKKSDVEDKYKKQSGGHGQYGHVKMRFEPSGDLETPYVFEQVVVGGAVPKNYFPAVEKGTSGMRSEGTSGSLSGSRCEGYTLRWILSSGRLFRDGIQDGRRSWRSRKALWMPLRYSLSRSLRMKVTVPDKYTGDVMGDLNKRRGRVLGMNPDHEGNTIIEADVPQLEIYGYSTTPSFHDWWKRRLLL